MGIDSGDGNAFEDYWDEIESLINEIPGYSPDERSIAINQVLPIIKSIQVQRNLNLENPLTFFDSIGISITNLNNRFEFWNEINSNKYVLTYISPCIKLITIAVFYKQPEKLKDTLEIMEFNELIHSVVNRPSESEFSMHEYVLLSFAIPMLVLLNNKYK
jgi:hypothetical protein